VPLRASEGFFTDAPHIGFRPCRKFPAVHHAGSCFLALSDEPALASLLRNGLRLPEFTDFEAAALPWEEAFFGPHAARGGCIPPGPRLFLAPRTGVVPFADLRRANLPCYLKQFARQGVAVSAPWRIRRRCTRRPGGLGGQTV